MAAANKTVWGIHTMDDPLFLHQNLIAIGWEEMGDLSVISASRDAYKEKYIATYPDAKKGSIATSAGMLYRFVHEVREDDYVVFPSKIARKINMKGNDRLVVAPTFSPDGGGLYLSWKF